MPAGRTTSRRVSPGASESTARCSPCSPPPGRNSSTVAPTSGASAGAVTLTASPSPVSSSATVAPARASHQRATSSPVAIHHWPPACAQALAPQGALLHQDVVVVLDDPRQQDDGPRCRFEDLGRVPAHLAGRREDRGEIRLLQGELRHHEKRRRDTFATGQLGERGGIGDLGFHVLGKHERRAMALGPGRDLGVRDTRGPAQARG